MHASLSDHDAIMLRAFAIEPRIIPMRGSARSHSIIATGAAIEINHHRLRTVHKAVFHEKFEQPG